MEKTRQTRLEQAATKAMRDPYLAGWVQTVRAAVRFAESYAKKERAKAFREAAETVDCGFDQASDLACPECDAIRSKILSLAKRKR